MSLLNMSRLKQAPALRYFLPSIFYYVFGVSMIFIGVLGFIVGDKCHGYGNEIAEYAATYLPPSFFCVTGLLCLFYRKYGWLWALMALFVNQLSCYSMIPLSHYLTRILFGDMASFYVVNYLLNGLVVVAAVCLSSSLRLRLKYVFVLVVVVYLGAGLAKASVNHDPIWPGIMKVEEMQKTECDLNADPDPDDRYRLALSEMVSPAYSAGEFLPGWPDVPQRSYYCRKYIASPFITVEYTTISMESDIRSDAIYYLDVGSLKKILKVRFIMQGHRR